MNILILTPIQVKTKSIVRQGGIGAWTDAYLSELLNHKIVNIDISPIGKRKIKVNSKRNYIDEIFRTYKIIYRLIKALKENKFDVAHINSSLGSLGIIRDYLCLKIIKKRKLKTIVQFHCDIKAQLKSNNIKYYFLGKISRLADKVLVLNKDSYLYLREVHGVKAFLVPNFINKEMIVKSHKINKKIQSILFVGYVQKEKGSLEIIDAAQYFPEIEFRLAGIVDRNIAKLEFGKNVVMLGGIGKEEVVDEMDKADVFLFPSYSEGFSIALLEAMARGLPIIATDVGANKEMIGKDGGIIINKKSVIEIRNAIKHIEDKNVREKMSINNIEKVKKYETKNVIKTIMNIYSL